jgi:biopolymer transport protein ExbD
MKLRTRQGEEPEIMMAPFIDVVFLLIIFFLVSTTFQHGSELTIQLPEAVTDAKATEQRPLEISIDAQGRYYVNGNQLVNTQLETLKQALADAARGRERPQLLVSADAATPHQAVIKVMDAARQLGLLNLSFATRRVEPEE